jgi:hypothetical protein
LKIGLSQIIWRIVKIVVLLKKDFTIESWKSDTDGLVYATIKENHQSDAMKQAGADPNTSPTVAHYRINANGELEKSSDGLNSWTVVSRTYYSD